MEKWVDFLHLNIPARRSELWRLPAAWQEPRSQPHGQLSFLSHQQNRQRGLAGRRGNLKFSWLHHFANCLLRTLQITTLLLRHFSSPIIMLTYMGTLFETPHETEVQFSCGGKWSTPGTWPVRWTYPASLLQPPSSLSRVIPLLHFLWEAAVLPLWIPTSLPGSGRREMNEDSSLASEQPHRLCEDSLLHHGITLPWRAVSPGHPNNLVFQSLLVLKPLRILPYVTGGFCVLPNFPFLYSTSSLI